MRRAAALAAGVLGPALLAGAGAAASPALSLPVDCTPGATCYVQSHVDRDPGPGAVDYTCGALSYDGHKGVDIRMPTLAAMRAGVDILAAAPGVVTATRANERDGGVAHMTAGRECGNGVVIDHGDGWETQYCHLARRSIGVAVGQSVPQGYVLGRMGLSGMTEFPHLHFSLRKDGAVVDPFDARPAAASCALEDREQLWTPAAAAALAYAPGGVVDAGFAAGPVTIDEVRAGLLTPPIRRDDEALVAWARAYGLSADDEFIVTLVAPDGTEIARNEKGFDRPRAEQMLFAGRKRPDGGWPSGAYVLSAEILRAGASYARETRRIAIE